MPRKRRAGRVVWNHPGKNKALERNGETAGGPLDVRGVAIWRGYLDRPSQEALAAALEPVLRAAPPERMMTPWGKPMRVAMTSAGRYGWVSGRGGYRYAPERPGGGPWPAIPAPVLDIWRHFVPGGRDPDCCLVNVYDGAARMGMHQDRDEGDFSWPVVSISLGDEALFRIGNRERGGRTESVWLRSGDVAVLGGAARLVHHGIDRVRAGSSGLLPGGGRINLTLRVVD